MFKTDDTRIVAIQELLPPVALLEAFPTTAKEARTVFESRQAIHNILQNQDPRLLVIIGPCSIHDLQSAHEYADLLLAQREKLKSPAPPVAGRGFSTTPIWTAPITSTMACASAASSCWIWCARACRWRWNIWT